MNRTFTTFAFNRVAKLEYPELINAAIAISEKYDPEALFINGMFVVLKQKQALLKNLEIVYIKNSYTEVLKGFLKRRERLLKVILSQTRVLLSANLDTHAPSLKVVLPFVDKYFKNIILDTNKIRSERIIQMFIKLDASAELQAALSTVGLNIYVDELRTLKISIEDTLSVRRENNSYRLRMNTDEVKATVSIALTNFLKSIEIAIIEHPAVDYSLLVNELNELFTGYKTEIKARSTRNKNAAESAKIKTDVAA